MSIAADLEKAWRNTAAALLPQDCFLCAAASGDCLLCPACSAGLPYLSAERCPLCALPTPGAAVCGACFKQAPHFDATQAVFRYEFPVDRLIQSLKYAHRLASANFLGRALAQLAAPLRPGLVLPVPLAPARLAERGFNQALELARPLARALGVPLDFRSLVRVRATAPQTGKTIEARRKNLRGAFALRGNSAVQNLRVALVDDVMTTGSTVQAAAQCLRAAGAREVEIWIIARA